MRRPPSELYAFWRDLPKIEGALPAYLSVTVKSKQVWHWVVRAPGGRCVEWDAEITNDEPNRLIVWHSSGDVEIANSGSVRFEPIGEGSNGTTVELAIEYTPPGGRLGALLGKATRGRVMEEVAKGLRRIKERFEAMPPVMHG